MSTGPGPRAAFIPGSQITVDHDASHSALFYLFQEVSKLSSPIHNSFVDTHSLSSQLNETSVQGPFIVKKEEEDAYLLQSSNSSHQPGLSQLMPYNQMKKMKEETHSRKVTALAEPPPECNSPWKVLSLINLQCEKLLHHGHEEESDPSSVSSDVTLGHKVDRTSTATAGRAGERTLRQSVLIARREKLCSGGAGKPESCIEDSKVGCCVWSQAAAKTDTVRLKLTAPSQLDRRDEREDELSVKSQFEWKQESKRDCFSSDQDFLTVPFSEKVLSQTHKASPNSQQPFKSNENASATQSKLALTLDHNANLTWTRELQPQRPAPPSSLSPSSSFSTTEQCHTLSELDNKITICKLERTHKPIEEKCPAAAQFKSSPSTTVKSEPKPVQKEETVPPTSQQWRTKTPRKQPHPSRSADIQDPDFQGVTFRMDTELDDNREQCRLLITSKYSKELCKSVRKPRPRTRTSQKSLKTSSSDEESDPMTSVSKGKVCASCCTRKTPMWRDAEDGTPLCNACGIRYKKYRVRCVNCWHIPRKEGNSNSRCLKCGNFVRLTSAQRKHTT